MNSNLNDRRGLLIVALGTAFNTALLGLPTAGLSLGLMLSYVLWRKAPWQPDAKHLFWPYIGGLALFASHFAEEYITEFYVAFPHLFGNSWDARRFVAFNLIWFGVFAVSAAGIRSGHSLSYLLLIFFALAGGVGNGIAHIAISIWRAQYFPGAATAPLMLAVGLLLLHLLRIPSVLLIAQGVMFTVLVPGAVVWWIPRNVIHVDWDIRHLVGWIPVAVGAALYFWCASQFLLRGKGTPNISFARHLSFLIGREPLSLVTSSIYRYSRNPMYVGVLMMIFGEAVLFGSLNLVIYGLVVAIWFHLVVVFIEEPHLRKTRGEEYLRYCRETPRWLPTSLKP
jgi:protein-S-isoprenylcysteine O-methyltransferase Ste14